MASAPHAAPPPAPLITPASPPAASKGSYSFAETWVSFNRWCQANGLGAPACTTPAPVPTYALTTSNGVFVLRAGSKAAYWDGLELRLGFAPQLIDGRLFLHSLDLQKTIRPLIAPADISHLSMGAGNQPEGSAPIIVIDPGHGGENAGTRSAFDNHYEKDFTLDWARRLEPLLTKNGWQVLLTRTNDNDLSLSNRVLFAQERKANLFLSLHFNSAAPKEEEAGLETYCLTPAGMPSTVTRGFSDDPTLAFPNNAFDVQNLQLALRVHRALLEVNGHIDRGLRRARFPGVLRGQQRPAILVEGGYLSNRREARLIADPAYRQKLAEAVANALSYQPATQLQKVEDAVGSSRVLN